MKIINKRHFGNENGPNRENFLDGYATMSTEFSFSADNYKVSQLVAKKARSPVYQYRYSHAGSINLGETFSLPPWKLILKVCQNTVPSSQFSKSHTLCFSTSFDTLVLICSQPVENTLVMPMSCFYFLPQAYCHLMVCILMQIK